MGERLQNVHKETSRRPHLSTALAVDMGRKFSSLHNSQGSSGESAWSSGLSDEHRKDLELVMSTLARVLLVKPYLQDRAALVREPRPSNCSS